MSIAEGKSQILLRLFSRSKVLTNFLMASRPTRALVGAERFLRSMLMVVISFSVRDKLFHRLERASSMDEGLVFRAANKGMMWELGVRWISC